MLDPLTALSLASSIVQLVDFSIELITDGVELYQRGSLATNDELEQASEDLIQLTEVLATTPPLGSAGPGNSVKPPSKDEIALQQLAKSCKAIGSQLLDILEESKTEQSQNGLESFRKAIRTIKNKDKIEALEKRLKRCQDQLSLRLLAILKDKNSSVLSLLDEISKNEIITSNKIESLKKEILAALENLKASQGQRTGTKELFSGVGTMCQDLAEQGDNLVRARGVLTSLHLDLVDILQGFSSSSNVKLCVSSRPWNVFDGAFGEFSERKLTLQDYTREDLRLFVTTQLKENERFSRLTKQDPRHNDLVEEMVEKAQGVFLWAYLVVRSLLRGLVDDNDISTLQRRLRALPPDLETYFKQILDTVETIYQEQTAQIFQMMVYASSQLSPLAFFYLEKEMETPNSALEAPINPLSHSEVNGILERIRKNLNARCKDLIEVNLVLDTSANIHRHTVDFLHRTVRDFLMTKDMQNMLSDMMPSVFDANKILCRVLLAEFKSCPIDEYSTLDSMIQEIMHHALEVEILTGQPEVDVLDEVGRVTSTDIKIVKRNSTLFHSSLEDNVNWKFMSKITEAGLRLYVAHKLDSSPQKSRRTLQQSLLSIAVRQTTRTAATQRIYKQSSAFQKVGEGFGIELDIFRVLLDGSAEPNGKYKRASRELSDSTIWQEFLQRWYEYRAKYSNDLKKALFQTAQLFIHYSADQDSKKYTLGRIPEFVCVLQTLQHILKTEDFVKVEELLSERQAAAGQHQRFDFWKWRGSP
ncbi:hypothetical protein EG329_005543 [Mollisiaceae sp. DMI_Dod_QoI]|nr:hypothetical protein EG329_005543 [Helotiales sp. DMI_Dod_QoI]